MNDESFRDLIKIVADMDRTAALTFFCQYPMKEFVMSYGEWLSRWLNMWGAIDHTLMGWTVKQNPGLWFYWY